MNVLFVCTGNTCRSPLAAAIARLRVPEVDAVSAGTGASPGAPATDDAVLVAQELGLEDLRHHSAQLLTSELVSRADAILVMEQHHLDRVEQLGGGDKARLLADDGVPDPYMQGIEAYRATARILERAAVSRLQAIEAAGGEQA